jgi:hypothetical protein
MYRNFAYEVVGQHRRLKATVKNCYFLTEFFKYFFRVLNEASSSWLKLFRVFQERHFIKRTRYRGRTNVFIIKDISSNDA